MLINTLAYMMVDSIQSVKREFVTNFVSHRGTREAMIGFIDAQAKYTKEAIDAGIKTSAAIGAIVLNNIKPTSNGE